MSNAFFHSLAKEQGAVEESLARNTAIADSIRASLLPHQLAVLTDPWKRKSALCPRRSGKSWTAMSYAFDICLRKPNARVVIVTLTLKSAKNIYWFELQDFARQYGVPIETYTNELRVDFPDGSKLTMIGAESKAQIEKLRGGKYDLVVIDEAKSYPPSILKELIFECVNPALLDRGGTLLMIGTPGNILSGPFFDATYPDFRNEEGLAVSRNFQEPEKYWESSDRRWYWSAHTWTLQDNTTTPEAWEGALMEKEMLGWKDDTPIWQREYLGKWVASEAAFVYAFGSLLASSPETVLWEPDYEEGNQFGLPLGVEWRYILGIDLGWEDDFAAVLGAYNPHDGILYQVWEYKDNHLNVDEASLHILRAIELAGKVDKIVADCGGLGKMVIETLNKRHGLNIEAAEKREKADFIELLNTDYHSGRIKLLRGGDLSLENQTLQWDLGESSKKQLARNGRLKEHPACPNHLCDAWLYLWRYSYHYWQDDRIVEHDPGTYEWQMEYNKKAMAQLAIERTQNLNQTFFDSLKNDSVDPLKDLDLWN